MRNQKRHFIEGVVFLVLALLSITLAPFISSFFHPSTLEERYIFSQIEFLFLVLCSISYLFSPKYYKGQILSFLWAILYFILFSKFYYFLN